MVHYICPNCKKEISQLQSEFSTLFIISNSENKIAICIGWVCPECRTTLTSTTYDGEIIRR